MVIFKVGTTKSSTLRPKSLDSSLCLLLQSGVAPNWATLNPTSGSIASQYRLVIFLLLAVYFAKVYVFLGKIQV